MSRRTPPRALPVLTALFLAAAVGGGSQTLEVLPAGPQARAVILTLPMDDAVSLAWPEVVEGGEVAVRSTTVPALMGNGEVERVLGDTSRPLPPVVVVTGPVRPDELAGLLAQLGRGREVAKLTPSRGEGFEEGGVERRLAAPGAEARLVLRLPLPGRADPLRPAAEVLAAMLPGLLGPAGERLAVRLEGDVAELARTVDPELADVTLDRLRLALARLADAPDLDPGEVARVRSRLAVRRAVRLERHPEGAEEIVRWWLAGGEPAVRQLLFGLEGVGPERVRRAARRWLVLHPGAAELVLPPRVLNPRFAPGPETVELPAGLTAAVLERPATPLECVVVRPVLSPDLDGGPTAAVLARLAAALRQTDQAPPWAEVERDPPRLELAAPAGEGAMLFEALSTGLEAVAADTTPVESSGGAEGRALALMAAALGLTSGGSLSPAALLRPDNLVLGAVVTDGEAAREALHKLLGEGAPPHRGAVATEVPQGGRTRTAVPGRTASMVVLLEGGAEGPAAELAARLVVRRVEERVGGSAVRLLEPVVPGGRPALLVVTLEATLPELESRLEEAWGRITAGPSEEELQAGRAALLAERARRDAGALGRAGLMAEVAAGHRSWLPPAQWQARVLAMEAGDVTEELSRWREWPSLRTTGAGPLPVSSLPLARAGSGR